ncbi:MAG: tRNA (adenosine(37)-N6)-threonylcarbamoyltransferase complex dimerization subunit type 1 TsaB [Clostridia bacterium]|nr:tRNA (adenosine(37)-N6)-threonylcarbamoyltransferase complex dimerization subunit type 1 TsaB [Clostridia bacterium]
MSKILVIDTSSKNLYLMLLDGIETTKIVLTDSQNQHSVLLNKAIDDLMAKTNTTIDQIDVFAVAIGVGSFTGIRVGVSVAKGLSFATNSKFIQVNTLQTLAYTKQGCINCLMDAGKGFYYAVYDGLNELTSPTLISTEEALSIQQLDNSVVFDSQQDYSDAIEKQVRAKFDQKMFSDALIPLYVRRCQAEEEREAKCKSN